MASRRPPPPSSSDAPPPTPSVSSAAAGASSIALAVASLGATASTIATAHSGETVPAQASPPAPAVTLPFGATASFPAQTGASSSATGVTPATSSIPAQSGEATALTGGGPGPMDTTVATDSPPVLVIGDLAITLAEEVLLTAFRTFLRGLDGKAKAAPEIKGRFERTLDFVLVCQRLYSLPEVDAGCPDSDIVLQQLLALQEEFITCPPAQRLAVASQVALKKLSDHFRVLRDSGDPKSASPCLELTRPVFEDAHRKIAQKHDLWRKNYRPAMSLNALLCLLS